MKFLLVLVLILIVLFGIVMIRKGMIRMDRDDVKTVIEVDTGRMGEAAKDSVGEVVDESKRIISETAESIDRAVSDNESAVPEGKPAEPRPVSPDATVPNPANSP